MNPLSHVKSWLYHLGNVGPARMAEIGRSHADLAVIDHAHGNNILFSKANMAKMRGGNDKLLISYLSIGEAETYRPYWKNAWDSTPPSWLGEANPEWKDNIKVKYWAPAWKKIVFDYLDQIIDQGFDGVYLDIIDAYYYWEDKAPRTGDFYRRKMVEFVEEIRDHAKAKLKAQGQDTDFAIIGQNGEDLAEYGRYLKAVDGIGKEDLYFYYKNGQPQKFGPVPKGWLSGSKELLEKAEKAGVKVMVVEYVPPRFSEQAEKGILKEINYLKGLDAPLYIAEERDLSEPYVLVSTDGIARQMGGSGSDRLEGGVWRDLINGRQGDDLLIGWGGRDKLLGSAGGDVLRGVDGRDVLDGGGGNDRLFGGTQSDRLIGGKGRDIATGGSGADSFLFREGDGRLTVTDFGKGADQLDLSDFDIGSMRMLRAKLVQKGADTHIRLGAGTLVLEDVQKGSLQADDFLF